jgi:fluoride ion exporter CrcB/FEX
LIRDGHVAAAVLYAVLSVVLGVCATMLGLWMARWWN